MLTPRGPISLATSVVDGRIYAIGDGGVEGQVVFSVVEEYDPTADTWRTVADMPTARGDLAASAVNGKIYAIGGIDATELPATFFSIVEEFDLGLGVDSGASMTPAGKLPTAWGKLKAQ